MDTFVKKQHHHQSLHWISVNWDSWTFQKEDSITPPNSNTNGTKLISSEEGGIAFERILCSGQQPQIIVTPRDLDTNIDQWVNFKQFESKDNLESNDLLSFHPRPNLRTSFLQPRDELENDIASIWRDILGFDQIGVHDDFFDLGGDSLLGMRIVNALQTRFNELIYITALFEAPTISKLAQYLQNNYFSSPKKSENHSKLSANSVLTDSKIEQFKKLISLKKQSPISIKTKSKKPIIFILCSPRSGSTLLRVMLGGHPKLFAPPELELLGFNTLLDRKVALKQKSTMYDGPLEAMMNIKNYSVKVAQRYFSKYENSDLTTQEFYKKLQGWIGNRCLVDKTPSYALNLDTLVRAEEYFTTPIFIHITRHPYGMIHSFEETKLDLLLKQQIRKKVPFSRRELAELIWLTSNQNILTFLKRVPPEKQIHIKFEYLVNNTKNALENIGDVLNIDFHPDTLNPYTQRSQRMTDGIHKESRTIGDPKFHRYTRIEPEVSNKWRTTENIIPLNNITWRVAECLGYEQLQKINLDNGHQLTKDSTKVHAEYEEEIIDQFSEKTITSLLKEITKNDQIR